MEVGCTAALVPLIVSQFVREKNHVHTVVSAPCKPERVLNAFKANATRKMREAGCWFSEKTPWVRKGSKIYLWTEKAVGYVLYDQGEPLD
jgi:REP element-mobilizing transposase RayT